MRLHLYWLENKKSWYSRGYANNYHLYVDYESKTYKLITNYMMCTQVGEHIEVKRKSDIDDYVKTLVRDGFNIETE